MTECTKCHKPLKTDSPLCSDCQTAYWTHIKALGHVQLPALTSIMLRQAHIGNHTHTPSKGHAPMPIDPHAQQLIEDSETWLAEQAGKINQHYANLTWHKAWQRLLANKHTILNQPTAAQDYAALQHIIRRNEQALTPEEDHIIIGDCPYCGHQLTDTPTAETTTCPHCQKTWPTPSIKAQRDQRLWQRQIIGTPADAAKQLQKYGLHATRNLISQWIRRGKIHPTQTGKHTYRFNLGELAMLLDCHR